MYLRTREQALDALAEILELRDRRDQLVQSTVKIMLCLDLDTRTFLVDCQDLLVLGGLEAVRTRRRELLSCVMSPHIAIESDEGRFFEGIAGALDALRFADAIRRVFPHLRHERWQVARAVLALETEVTQVVDEAIRSRGDLEVRSASERTLREIILSLQQPWMDRSGAIRSACLQGIRNADLEDPDGAHEEADQLFELFATSDGRATDLLQALDRSPGDALRQVGRVRDVAGVIRLLGSTPPPPPAGRSGNLEVA